ncbi:MAG TPA: mannosyltransferase family protein [Solirubrobacteraceae bacterium]|jgi:hypothetical protein|nr:mannosyltransferase family protein [Solirubrobacteraceae bacterium]
MAGDRIPGLGAFVLSRAVAWGAGAAAIAVFGLHANAERFDPGGAARGPGAFWDSVWFLAIARDGYDRPEDAAFFPLYPLLLRATGASVGGGVLVSLACFAAALWLLHALVALDFGARVARVTVLLVAVFPAATFFGAVYSEALFLLLSVAAVYGARTDRWGLAGVAGALAASTRSAGLVLLVPLALLWWSGGRRPRDGLWLALVPLGLVLFCAYLALDGGDGLAPLRAQDAWGRELTWPLGGAVEGASAAWEGARQIVSGEPRTWPVYDTAWLDVALFGTLLAALVALAGAVRRLPVAYSLYAAAALALPLTFPADGQPLMSLPRFVAVLWPLHLWLALVLVERARSRRAVVAVSVAGLAAVSAETATWGWVA